MNDPLVSIIIPTYDRPELLAQCLRSIEETVTQPHEIVGVYVAGDDQSRLTLDNFRARSIEQPDRSGFVKAVNLGLRAARGEYVLTINDDCVLLPHSLANAVRFLLAPGHERVGQVAFFHNSPVSRNIYTQIQLDDVWFYVCHVRGLCYANFGLARRELYEQLDYYDERFFMYGADPDFSLKVWHEAKLTVVPCPGALIRHLELNDDRAIEERARQDEDNHKLFEKWDL